MSAHTSRILWRINKGIISCNGYGSTSVALCKAPECHAVYRNKLVTEPLQRRWIRGSRFGRVISNNRNDERDLENQSETSVSNNEGNQSIPHRERAFDDSSLAYEEKDKTNHSKPIRKHIDGEKVNDGTYNSEAFPDYPQISRPGRRSRVDKLIKYAATYGDVVDGKVVGDPFLTTPYVKEANLRFDSDQGNSALEEAARKRFEATLCNVILFPGQGSQYVGMCGDPKKMPRSTQAMFEIASTILEYDLLDLCLNGPIEKLNATRYCQPAVVVCSLAAIEKLREENPEELLKTVATAGFSVGEIAALVYSGILSFEDSIRLVKVRAEAMQLASEIVPSGLSTVLLSSSSKLNYAMLVAKEWCTREHGIENPVCSAANFLFPHCRVVGGHIKALEFLEMNYQDFNLRKVKRLPVSGAFHTELMKPAAEPLKAIMEQLVINKPRMPVYSNVTGYRYHSSNEVRRRLCQQIYKPVKWEQTLHTIYQRPKDVGYPSTYECGPGSSLRTVLKQVNSKAHEKCQSIQLEV